MKRGIADVVVFSAVLALLPGIAYADKTDPSTDSQVAGINIGSPLFAATPSPTARLTDSELLEIRGAGVNANYQGYYAALYAGYASTYMNYARYTAPANSYTEQTNYLFGVYYAGLSVSAAAAAAYYSLSGQ